MLTNSSIGELDPMPVPDNLQNIPGYFQKSGQFYYILIDQQGFCIKANHLFQALIATSSSDLQSIPIKNFLSANDGIKYLQTAAFCFANPASSRNINLNITGATISKTIKWEFSVITGSDDAIQLICGIGVEETSFKNIAAKPEENSEKTTERNLSQELVEQEVHKQKQITQATIDGQEKERQQIGKELHDNINQHLTTTRLYLEVAKEKASGELKEMIELSHKNLVSIINEIRNLSQSLVPPTLGDLGLVESIQDLCDSLKRVHTFKIDFIYRYFNEQLLPDNLKLMLFRITQEQVNNIIRHAEADKMQIWLQLDAEHITLTIIDNGKGFNPATTKKGQGFNNIANRTALFNGKAEIEAMPGKGCSLTVVIPVS